MMTKTSSLAAAVLAVGLFGALAGCTSDVALDQSAPPAVEAPPSSEAPDAGSEPSGQPQETTMEQAGVIATDAYGGTIKSIEDDTHNGEPTWEVELVDSSQGRIEVEVSKGTGEIVSVEQD